MRGGGKRRGEVPVKAKPEEGIWLDDVPEPQIGPDDVLIKISKTAICGTDIHIYNWDDWAAKNVPTGSSHVSAMTGADVGASGGLVGRAPRGQSLLRRGALKGATLARVRWKSLPVASSRTVYRVPSP